jgi:hypothetical protein
VRSEEMKYEKKRENGEFDFEMYSFVVETAGEIFEEITMASKGFPEGKVYLADLACRHSKLVYINLQEAWRMKEHKTIFLDKLSDAAQAASKAQDVLKFASKYNYIDGKIFKKIDERYEDIFEEIFTVLCNGKKITNHSRGNGKRVSVDKEMVALG